MSASPNTTNDPPWLIEWRKLSAEAQRIKQLPFGTSYARRLSSAELKREWDNYDGTDDPLTPPLTGEAIHLVLNERGEGDYCAV